MENFKKTENVFEIKFKKSKKFQNGGENIE